MKYVSLALLFLGLGIFLNNTHAQDNTVQPVLVLEMKGAIGPAFTDYLKQGIAKAKEQNAQLLLIELNTPGGLLTSTRDMVSLITEAPLPIAVYVTPSGAHAASAGTFILYASHVAAMSEGTNLGAAPPVEMGGPTAPNQEPSEDKETKSNQENVNQKALEDTKAFIRGLAEMRERNVEFAENTVVEATSLTAKEALEQNVIEYIASNRDDLLKQIDGKKISLKNGDEITLDTQNAPIEVKAPDWRTQILSIITDPNVALILMTIGIYGLILEFYNPGTFIPGTIGAVCLITGLFAMNILPVNAAGIILIVAGILFIIGETFVPSFGILGAAGIGAFIFGSVILFDSENLLGLAVSMETIIGLTAVSALVVGILVWLTVNAIQRKVSTGIESMVGDTGIVVSWNNSQGTVRIQGEIWTAYSDRNIELSKDEEVLISKVDKLKVKIRKA